MTAAQRTSSLYKQEKFAIEYLKDHNMTQAAIRAGYARKGAAASGRRLLKNNRVQERMKELTHEQALQEAQKCCPMVERQEIVDFLTMVLRGGDAHQRFSLTNEIQLSEQPGYSIRERLRAAELLGRNFHWFEEAPQEFSPEETPFFLEATKLTV